MIVSGSQAPSFSLPGTDGNSIGRYDLSEYTEKGTVVLLFYPFDFSPVCTAELCGFRDSEWLTFTPDLDIFGVSTDSAFSHRAFSQQNDLPFPLLSDRDGRVSEQYGVLYEELEGHPRVSKRAVFVIDDDQTVQYAWEADEYTTDPDIDEVHRAVEELASVEV